MINYADALQLIRQTPSHSKMTVVNTNEALGSISNQTIRSRESLPAFNNSAMDGFALTAKETLSASQHTPAYFQVDKVIAAGDPPYQSNDPRKSCAEIMTGAPLPEFYDCVVPVEEVLLSTNRESIAIKRPIKIKENVRYSGEDFTCGDVLINQYETITAEHIMAFSALGIDNIEIQQKPRVAILCTGSELTSRTLLKPGEIRNSNGPYLLAALKKMGCEPSYFGTVSDSPQEFTKLLHKVVASKPDVIISTGAVSAGLWDFIPKTLSSLNAKIIFHKVKVRPGKPILYAQLENGTPYFGLSGNPIASAVGLRFFVYPYLRRLQNLADEKSLSVESLSSGMRKADFTHFLKARLTINSLGKTEVSILPGQESFKIKPLLNANCWVALNDKHHDYKSGEILSVYPLHCDLSANTGELFS